MTRALLSRKLRSRGAYGEKDSLEAVHWLRRDERKTRDDAGREDGRICLDVTGKKNGRGAYVCKSRECLLGARRNKGLERSFKMSIPNEVYDTLEREFENLDAE